MTTEHDVVVLIGAGGIGQAIARRRGVGKTILVADLREQNARATADLLADSGFRTESTATDISSRESVRDLARKASELGRVTDLVLAAGVSPVQASKQAVLEVDLRGSAYVLDAFGEIIAPGGSGIVVSSQAGHMIPPSTAEEADLLGRTPAEDLLDLEMLDDQHVPNSGAAYAVAKRANALRVQAEAVAWGERGARLNSISPGIILTPLARQEMSGPGAEGYRAMVENSAAGRVGTTDEVGEAADFLMSTPFITGTDLLIDGGVIAGIRGGTIALDM